MNPFIRLYTHPIQTLTALAYTLTLLATTIALAGILYRLTIRLSNELEYRHDGGNYAPAWQLIPPWRVIGMLSGAVFLLAVEVLLVAGIIYML